MSDKTGPPFTIHMSNNEYNEYNGINSIQGNTKFKSGLFFVITSLAFSNTKQTEQTSTEHDHSNFNDTTTGHKNEATAGDKL